MQQLHMAGCAHCMPQQLRASLSQTTAALQAQHEKEISVRPRDPARPPPDAACTVVHASHAPACRAWWQELRAAARQELEDALADQRQHMEAQVERLAEEVHMLKTDARLATSEAEKQGCGGRRARCAATPPR